MSLSQSQKIQLKLYALFMIVDGEASDAEKARLNSIFGQANLGGAERREILDCCKEANFHSGDNSDRMIEMFRKLVTDSTLINEENNVAQNRCMQAETIWTLLNLGYADEVFPEPEQKVIQYMIKWWGMKDVLVNELVDTADTLLLLTKQKERLNAADNAQKSSKERIQEIDRRMDLMFGNIKATIAEADAV